MRTDKRTQFMHDQREIEDLAAEELDEALGFIQRRLGVTSGDTAAALFSDDAVLKKLIQYIETERSLNQPTQRGDSMNFVLCTNTNDEPVYAVEVNGMTIYNLRMSECGRFTVDPLQAYGLDSKTVDALALLNAHFNYSTEC